MKKKEDVPEEIWKFPKIGSTKQRQFYVKESMAHPANRNSSGPQ